MAMAWLQRPKTFQDSSSLVMQSCGQLELPRLSKPENEKAVRRQRSSPRVAETGAWTTGDHSCYFLQCSIGLLFLIILRWGWVRNRPRIRVCANGDRFDEFNSRFKGWTGSRALARLL